MVKIKIFYTVLFFVLGSGVMLQAQDAATAASLYNEALEKLKAKDYAAAYPLLQQALEIADPEKETDAKVIDLSKKNGARATYSLGSAARKAKEYDKAIEYFNTGIEWMPDYYANHLGLAQSLEGKGDLPAALNAYVKAADLTAQAGKARKRRFHVQKSCQLSWRRPTPRKIMTKPLNWLMHIMPYLTAYTPCITI